MSLEREHRKIYKVLKQISKKQCTSIDDFEIGKIIGEGTFGVVNQVFYKRYNQQPFALKILNKENIVKQKQIKHVENEKNVLESISHPFIVNLFKCFQNRKNLYMLFEFIQGGELFTRIKNEKRISEEGTKFYLSQVILIIIYLHKKNIIYRDIKPENILIDHSGYIKLTDFGFAKFLTGENHRTYTLCGTPDYLPPEIIEGGQKGYSKSVDWWSLGVLMYEMLVGVPPFQDKAPINIYRRIVEGRFSLPEFISDNAQHLIRGLLTKNIDRRLGCNDNGKSILRHKFFDDFSFEEILSKQMTAPWIPEVNCPIDTVHFQQYRDQTVEKSSMEYGDVFSFFDQF